MALPSNEREDLELVRGILYIATGERCCSEAILNAQRCRRSNPSLPITIKTDLSDRPDLVSIFDSVISIQFPSHSYRDKVTGFSELPYEQTLFLDSDACLIAPIDDIFDLLKVSDLAAAHAPVRHPPGWSDDSVPRTFPELNTGVMLMRRSRVIDDLMSAWIALYDDLLQANSQFWDQASFRSVLWNSLRRGNLRFLHLPTEANLRTTKPWFAGRGLPVSVVHGRFSSAEFKPFVEFLNADVDRFRTWEQWLHLHPKSSIRPRFDRTFG